MLLAGRIYRGILQMIETEEDAQKKAELFQAYKDSLEQLAFVLNGKPELPRDDIRAIKGAIQE